MNELDKLTPTEKEMLLKFPAYITLLATNYDKGLDEVEKKTAMKFSHIKTYSSHLLLREFYKEADKHLEQNITLLNSELPQGRDERAVAIENELSKLDAILKKLGKEYAQVLHDSMRSFKEHVSKAHRNVLEYFIFPMPIKGLSD